MFKHIRTLRFFFISVFAFMLLCACSVVEDDMSESKIELVENQPYVYEGNISFVVYNFHKREAGNGNEEFSCALSAYNSSEETEFPILILFAGEEYSVAEYSITVLDFDKENKKDSAVVTITEVE